MLNSRILPKLATKLLAALPTFAGNSSGSEWLRLSVTWLWRPMLLNVAKTAVIIEDNRTCFRRSSLTQQLETLGVDVVPDNMTAATAAADKINKLALHLLPLITFINNVRFRRYELVGGFDRNRLVPASGDVSYQTVENGKPMTLQQCYPSRAQLSI